MGQNTQIRVGDLVTHYGPSMANEGRGVYTLAKVVQINSEWNVNLLLFDPDTQSFRTPAYGQEHVTVDRCYGWAVPRFWDGLAPPHQSATRFWEMSDAK